MGIRGQNRYGVPSHLPDGRANPEYHKLRYEDMRGTAKRRGPRGFCKECGCTLTPHIKVNGSNWCRACQRKYHERWRRSRGMGPHVLKYGVPHLLQDGWVNPEWRKRMNLARRAKTLRKKGRPFGYSMKYGVPYTLPDGKINPEWSKAFNNSPKTKQWKKEYRLSQKGKSKKKMRYNKRSRGLPTKVILGAYFKGSHLHHLTIDIAVYIPESLHRSIPHQLLGKNAGYNMDKINTAAMEFYERGGLG